MTGIILADLGYFREKMGVFELVSGKIEET
jgi:hypothetical protein